MLQARLPADCVPVQCSSREQSLVQVRPVDHSHADSLSAALAALISFLSAL